MNACCGTSITVHVKFARAFIKYIDSSYKFENKIYVTDSGMKLYCVRTSIQEITALTLCVMTVMLPIEKGTTYLFYVLHLQRFNHNMYHLYHPELLLLI